MFESLPAHFRSHGIPTDVRALLLLEKSIEKGLIRTLGDIYNVLKAIIVKEKSLIGPYTKAFYEYFLEIDIKDGERLNDAILRSKTFKKWKEDFNNEVQVLDEDTLVNKFLDEIHLTTYDIKEVINGKELWDKDNPYQQDSSSEENGEATERNIDKMADYSELTLQQLLERMETIKKNQKTSHSGGSHWIGTGGISPYGHGGAAKAGVRVGGTGGGKMARAVLNDKNYYPVDVNKLVNDNNIDAALASLKGVIEESAHDEIDIQNTIKLGIKRGGLFIPEIKKVSQEKLQVILLIDNGGYSMLSYVRVVRELFKKMKTRFAHDLETYYFHNTIYGEVYADPNRTEVVKIKTLLNKDANYRVFIIGDATMGTYEINQQSVNTYQSLKKKFKKIAWINPEPVKYWPHTISLQYLKQLIDMYPMTPKGIEDAVRDMNIRR
ncbi:hypothetical protein [Arcticibacterium luteifluviistationis]|uniref:VWA containing CoxE family protein n=1 Tax=Arcticibacterium luteifluviistationis TaxID=1784714 RepID=A0A2Z4GFJ9_9BACT|nr:hypothetical protein [Arcticibacterium luteifluviistationis]AWW00021.1 hypothetical protein DJ013_18345 [Arcticibacterium luteifluviistationis]